MGLSLIPLTVATARDSLPPERSRPAIALLSVTVVSGIGVGYPLTGLIAEHFGLHASFRLGAAVSGMALVAAMLVLPSTRHLSRRPGRIHHRKRPECRRARIPHHGGYCPTGPQQVRRSRRVGNDDLRGGRGDRDRASGTTAFGPGRPRGQREPDGGRRRGAGGGPARRERAAPRVHPVVSEVELPRPHVGGSHGPDT
ncbi:MFS transporter [Streptomyces sp. 900105755]